MPGLRRALIHVVLLALILRAFLPAGWMPNLRQSGEVALVVCTMDGPVSVMDGKALPGKDDPRAHETCPFAMMAQPVHPNEFAVLAAPELSSSAAPVTLASGLKPRQALLLKPSSRAPPSYS
jgi:hypothetical protein